MNALLRAALMMSFGMLLIPVGDAFAKALSGVSDYSGAAIAWARFTFGALVAAPIILSSVSFRGLGGFFWRVQALRGVLLAAVVTMIIEGVSAAPLADAFGAFFVGPLVATLLAAALLRERVSPANWAAVLVGFVGVCLAAKPVGMLTGDVSPGIYWALGAGLAYGGYLTATRWGAGAGPAPAQLLVFTAVSALALSPIAVPEFAQVGLIRPDLLLGASLTSLVANFAAILAFRQAEAAAMAPLVYAQLLSAAAISWAVFGDAPDRWTTLGLAVIMAAGLSPLLGAAARAKRVRA